MRRGDQDRQALLLRPARPGLPLLRSGHDPRRGDPPPPPERVTPSRARRGPHCTPTTPRVSSVGETSREGDHMAARVTSVFLYVSDVIKSVEFYHEIVGAEVQQLHAEQQGGPITLAILRIGDFALMI